MKRHQESRGKLVIFGAWHFSDLVEELAIESGWQVAGRIDPQPPQHISALQEFPEDACCFVAIGNNRQRRYVADQLNQRSRRIISLFHPSASISSSATPG